MISFIYLLRINKWSITMTQNLINTPFIDNKKNI